MRVRAIITRVERVDDRVDAEAMVPNPNGGKPAILPVIDRRAKVTGRYINAYVRYSWLENTNYLVLRENNR
jgi:hypothetical protein